MTFNTVHETSRELLT